MNFTIEENNAETYIVTMKTDKGVCIEIWIDPTRDHLDGEVFIGGAKYYCTDDDIDFICLLVDGDFRSVRQIINEARRQLEKYISLKGQGMLKRNTQ